MRRTEWTAAAKKDIVTQAIFVCLYRCPANCETDPSCVWKGNNLEELMKRYKVRNHGPAA